MSEGLTIKYDDFAKLDLKVGTILDAQPHPDAEKLLVLQVDLGSEKRQIVAGIKKFYACEQLKGVQIVVITNLEPRTLRGVTSHGMLLAASDPEDNPDWGIAGGSLALLTVAPNLVRAGSKVG